MTSHNEKPKKSGKCAHMTGIFALLKPSAESGSAAVRRYLVAYNVLSVLGWSYVVFVVSAHLSGFTGQSHLAHPSPPPSPMPALRRILGSMPYLKPSAPIRTQEVQSRIPPFFLPVLERARTTFTAVGWQTALVQSFATLEIIHSLLGWVRSPVQTTTMQVASRLILVWGIADQYESVSLRFLAVSLHGLRHSGTGQSNICVNGSSVVNHRSHSLLLLCSQRTSA